MFYRYLYPKKCVKERRRQQISVQQASSLFYLLLGGCCLGCIALFWEIYRSKTVKRFSWNTENSGNSHDSFRNQLKQLAVNYEVKAIVDAINEKGDVWVCHTPKSRSSLVLWIDIDWVTVIFPSSEHYNIFMLKYIVL